MGLLPVGVRAEVLSGGGIHRLRGFALSFEPNDEIFNKAGARYMVERRRRSRLKKSTAFVANLALSIASQVPDTPIASQDLVVLVDRRTDADVLKWADPDHLPDQLSIELDADLRELTIRQFETKWGISS